MSNLNATNEILLSDYAEIQETASSTAGCLTLDMEVNHLNARGKERLWLPEMA